MIKLKKLITIAVLVSMIPGTLVAQGEENIKGSEEQKVSTTETGQSEANLVEMTATSGHEVAESSTDSATSRTGLEEDSARETIATSEHKGTESAENSVHPEKEIAGDGENVDVPVIQKVKSANEDSVGEVTEESNHEKIKSANDMFEQGVQCERNWEFCKAIELYKQAAKLGSIDAINKLVGFYAYDEKNFKVMCDWCRVASDLLEAYEEYMKVSSRYDEKMRSTPFTDPYWYPSSDSGSDSDTGSLAEVEPASATEPDVNSVSKDEYASYVEECSHAVNMFRFTLCEKAREFEWKSDEWDKNAANVVEMYSSALKDQNTESAHKYLDDFSECCQRMKKEEIEKVLNWCEIAEKTESADTLYNLAEIYECGKKLKDDYIKVCEWCDIAVKVEPYKGCANVAHKDVVEELLTDYYERGKELKEMADDEDASELAKKVAKVVELHEKEKDPEKMEELVRLCNGYIVTLKKERFGKRYEKVANVGKMYEKAMEDENPRAMYKLAFYYKYGKGGIPKNLNRARELFQKASDLGDRDAMYGLACCYIRGEGILQDLNKAEFWLQRAAEKGNAYAMHVLALFWEWGIERQEDLDNAISWYERAGNFGDADAIYRKGRVLRRVGDVRWYDYIVRAAEKGSADAIAVVLYNRPWSNLKMYRQAVELGHPEAVRLYVERFGGDMKEELYEQAAEDGHVSAMVKLVQLEVNPDKWLSEAIDLGYAGGTVPYTSKYYVATKDIISSEMLREREKECYEISCSGDKLSLLMSEVERLYLEKEVQKGNSYAMFELGSLYESGYFYRLGHWECKEIGRYVDVFKAFRLYKQAAENGHLASMFKVSKYYYRGGGVRKDAAKAEEWLMLSAESGSVEGMYEYAVFLEEVDFRTDKAIEWYNKVVEVDENRHAEIIRRLGICYKFKFTTNEGLRNSINYLNRAVALGDTEAMRQLGICYENGEGVVQSLSTAANLYQRAAELGNTKAMVNLVSCYENGNGVPQDLNTAVKWLRQAVALGDSDAMFKLASWYEHGKGGLPKNLEKVACLLGQAAGSGHVRAKYKLGLMYINGEGVDKNLAIGISWLRQAATEKSIEALRDLSSCYKKGDGVPQNDAIARNLSEKAEVLSKLDKICKSAYKYAYGVGVEQDLNMAVGLGLVATTECPVERRGYMLDVLVRDLNWYYNKAVAKGISLDFDVSELMETYEYYLLD